MQRYKLNTRFLIILVVLFGVVLGGSYGLWAFQVYKSAPGIKAEAQKASEEKRYQQANELWRRYLNFRTDDIDAHIRYAETQLEFAESGGANPDELMVALAETERILRNHPIPRNQSEWSEEMVAAAPKLDALRSRTVETKANFMLWKDAIDHLDYLIDVRGSKDPKHEVLRLRALVGSQNLDGENGAIRKGFELVGYDEIEREFDESKAVTPHETEAYVLLATTLRRHQKKDQLADRVMNQLVAVNPKSHEAFLQRSLYWQQQEQWDLAQQDWERAYALNQEELSILLTGARLAVHQEDYGLAVELAQAAVESYPDDYRTYIEVARAQGLNGEREAALETVDEGLRTVDRGLALFHLLIFKCDLLLQENQLDESREAIDMLAQLLPSQEIPRYFEGRILLAERKWVDAIKVLEEARPGLDRREIAREFPTILPNVDRFRGFAYQQLGQYDLARQAWRESLRQNPDQPQVAQMLERLERLVGRSPTTAPSESVSLGNQVAEMLQRPPHQQQWKQIEDAIQSDIERLELDEATAKIYWADFRNQRGQTEQAYELLQDAISLDPPPKAMRGAIHLAFALPEAGPEVAHRLIDQAVEKFGDNSTWRLERARIWIRENKDNLVGKLWSLNEGTEGWDDHQRTHFLKELANYFRQIGHPDEADQALNLASDVSPQDLDALMDRFTIARQRGDNAAMQEVQRRIEEVVGSKSDNRWQYTEAARLITLYAAGLRDPGLLEQASKLTDAIAQRRPEWHELYRLRGDIFTLRGRSRDAIAAYDRALELGPPNPMSVRQHVQLLLMQQRYLDALRVANRLPEESRLTVLGTLYPEILLRTANPSNRRELERSLELAQQVVENDPENSAKQLWYADQLLRHNRISEAEGPVRKALALNPQDTQTWLSLVRYLAGAKRPEDAEQALREARLALPEHDVPLLLAQGYALIGKWWQAEREYLTALRTAPDDLRRVRMLADFYLGMFYPNREDRYAKAVPYINRLLQQGVDGAENLESIQWARRKAAEIFASTGDYQNALKAEKLLQANMVDGQMPAEDKIQLARILASRPEPGSRRKAIGLIEEVQSESALDQDGALLLAQLYWKTGRHDDAREQIFNVVARHGDNTKVWQTFVAMHLAQGFYKDAAQYFQDKLEQTLPKPLTLANLDTEAVRTLALGVQVWNKMGQKEKALATLYGAIPRSQEDLRDEDVSKLLDIGALLVLIGEKDKAAPVYQLFAMKRPRQALVYVKFLGAYQDVEKAFEYLQKFEQGTEPADIFPVVQTALSIVNARRDEIGDSKDALVESWLQKGLRENPDSTALLGLKADMLEMQKKYDEAQAIYERMLATRGFSGVMRSPVLNNLAYLLALQDIDTDRALKLVEEARAIAGPSDDILDTRGVIHMARGNYNAAIDDLELAVSEDPDASKWFHLARAYWLAGRRQDAVGAWERAQDLDLGPEKLNRMEHETFHNFSKEVAQHQSRSGSPGRT